MLAALFAATFVACSSDPPPPALADYDLVQGTVDVPIPARKANLTDGKAPITYRQDPTSPLPGGITVNPANGEIQGTPRAPVTQTTFDIIARDAAGREDRGQIKITINAAIQFATRYSNIEATVGAVIPTQTPVTTGGVTLKTYAISPPLPAGLAFNTTSGSISGSPTATLPATAYTVSSTDTNNAVGTTTFTITVTGAPVFSVGSYTNILTSVGQTVTPQTPTVGGGTGVKTYAITPALSAQTGLSFNTATGQIGGVATTQRVTTAYTVTATDANGVSGSSSLDVTVNSNIAFQLATPYSDVSASVGVLVLRPTALVINSVGTVTYSVSPALPGNLGAAFSASTGAIASTAPDTASPNTVYTVTARDSSGSSATTRFSLGVNSRPVFASATYPNLTVTAGQPNAVSYTPSVSNGSGSRVYSFVGGNPAWLSIDSATGKISGQPNSSQAASAPSPVTVKVEDANSASDTTSFTVRVSAVPTLGAYCNQTITKGTMLLAASVGCTGPAKTQAPVASGGLGMLAFSVAPAVPSGLFFNPASGELTNASMSIPNAVSSLQSYTVTATDSNGATARQSFTLEVKDALNLAYVTPHVFVANLASSLAPRISGGTGPLSYALASPPVLPNGVNFDTLSGVFSSTATQTALPQSYSVTVTDANGATLTKSVSLAVSKKLAFNDAYLNDNLTYGQAPITADAVTMTNASGSSIAYSVSPALSGTLAINPSTGALTGAPAATGSEGSITYTVTAVDSGLVGSDQTATVQFTVSFHKAPDFQGDYFAGATDLITAPSGSATAGYTYPAPAVNFGYGSKSYSGSGSSGAASWVVNPSTGEIALTVASLATTQNATVTVTVKDANNVADTATLLLTLNPTVTLAVPNSAVINTTVGIALTAQNLAVTGGTGAISCSSTPSLPSGVSLAYSSGACALSGTPTVSNTTASSRVYALSAVDSKGSSATRSLTLTVNPDLVMPAIANVTVTVGQATAATRSATASGGTPTVSYSLTPAGQGVTISNTGTVSVAGTATAATYTATATDGAGLTSSANDRAAQTFAVSLNAAPKLPFATADNIVFPFVTGQFFDLTTGTGAVTGGTLPRTLSVSPALPDGLALTFDDTTGAIRVVGTPVTATSAGTVTYTVTLRDANGVTDIQDLKGSIRNPLGVKYANIDASVGVPLTSLQGQSTVSNLSGTVSYSVSGLPAGLSINPSSGAISGTPSAANMPSSPATVTVTATDTGSPVGNTATTVQVRVYSKPSFGSANYSAIIATASQSKIQAAPAITGGAGTRTLVKDAACPAYITVNSSNGAVTVNSSSAQAAVTCTITVTDQNGASDSATVSATVNAAPSLSSLSEISATLNRPIAAQTVAAAGGTASLSDITVSPALPAGLSFTSGTLSGTPSAAATSNSYTFAVTDANGVTATSSLQITVNPAVNLAPIAAVNLTSPQASVTRTLNATGGTGAITYAALSALPSGVSLAGNTVTVTSSATTGNVTLSATDVNGSTSSQTLNIAVYPALSWTDYANLRATQGQTITPVSAAALTGGLAPITYSASGLPAGLLVNAATGQIIGTPTTAPSNAAIYNVTATDSNGSSVVQTVNISVRPALSLSYPNATIAGTLGVARSSGSPIFNASNVSNAGAVTYSVSPTTFPSGVSFTNGVLAGTPTQSWPTTTYTVTATNAADSTYAASATTAQISLGVTSSLAVSYPSGTFDYTQGIAISTVPVTVTGGVAPYSFSGVVPTGLTLNANGSISGTPTVASPATTYIITVQDSLGVGVNATITIRIVAPLIFTSNYSPLTVTVGQTTSKVSNNGVTGGVTPITYTLSPTAPSWLTVPNAIITSGTVTGPAGTTRYTVTATDARGSSTTRTIDVIVNPAPALTYQSQTDRTRNATLSASPNASGGTAPYSFLAATLGTGVSVNLSGVISADLNTALSGLYTATVTDANGVSASGVFNLTVVAPPSLSGYQNVTLTENQRVLNASQQQTPLQSGGTPTGSYSADCVNTNQLGLYGLRINTTTGKLELSGPNVTSFSASTASFGCRVSFTDANNLVAISNLFNITINPAPTITTGNIDILKGRTITTPAPTVTEGSGPAATPFALSCPNFTGASFSSSTGAFSGTATTDGFDDTCKVTYTDINNVSVTSNAFRLNVLEVNLVVSDSNGSVGSGGYVILSTEARKTFTVSITAGNGRFAGTFSNGFTCRSSNGIHIDYFVTANECTLVRTRTTIDSYAVITIQSTADNTKFWTVIGPRDFSSE